MTNALRYFNRAIEIEPNYAPAHAGLALAYVFAATWVGPSMPATEAAPRAKVAAQRAIELDPTLADPHVALGYARMAFDWDWTGAEQEFRRAFELSPRSTLVLDSWLNILVPRARFDEAIAVMNRALERDPLSPALHADLGWTYWVAGRFEQAIPHYQTVLELDPNFHVSRSHLGWSYLMTGQTNKALAELQRLVRVTPDYQWAHAYLGEAYGFTGRRAEALQTLALLDELGRKRYVNPCAKACVYVGLGQTDAALALLEQAYREHDSWIIVLLVEPPYAPLRNQPRFQELLKKLGHVK